MANKSRHTVIAGRLSRSFGITDGDDLVAEFRDDGTISIREEPTERKLRRGEKLPEVVLNVREVWETRKNAQSAEDAKSLIEKVCAKLPIADLSGTPERVGYQAKVWLLNALKHEMEKQ